MNNMNIDKHTYRMWCHGNQIWVLPFDADFLVSPAESITSTAHRCAGHHLRPGTTLYLRENNASREFASVGGWDPKIPRLQGQFPSGWTILEHLDLQAAVWVKSGQVSESQMAEYAEWLDFFSSMVTWVSVCGTDKASWRENAKKRLGEQIYL